jgi:putative DNA methylase
MSASYKKKLIEVALPLDAINKASAREKSIRHGHPSTLHLWWARRPLATARAVIFSQMVDDPSGHPDLFPTEKAQEKERKRLFKIIEDLVIWENTTNEEVLQQARDEIWQSWRRTCAENADHPQAKELFDRHKLPAFHDPFAGGGALPLEAQRLGLESHASDLNPVAVLINKAMIEIPPKFAGKPPVNPEAHKEKKLIEREWKGAEGLAEDVRYYGQWMRDEAEKRIGHLYPKVEITQEMVKERPDLKKYSGKKLTVIAWLWARTVKSPNPAFADVDVPLASTFMLSTKKGKEAYVEPVIEGKNYHFTVKVGNPKDASAAKSGTKLARGANFRCLMSGMPIAPSYIKEEGKSGQMGERLMAIVVKSDSGPVFLNPMLEHETIAQNIQPEWKPDVTISGSTQYLGVQPYGIKKFSELFTSRQLVALTNFSELVHEAKDKVITDAKATSWQDDKTALDAGGIGTTAYADAVSMYLSLAISKQADRCSSVCTWAQLRQHPINTFSRQALGMTWDFAESNPVGASSGNFFGGINSIFKALQNLGMFHRGSALQINATEQTISVGKVVSTDPPYYDNVPYADLSDFFYIWLRPALKPVFEDLFTTIAVPKVEELVAFAHRHAGKSEAESFFLNGMTQAVRQLAKQSHSTFPLTIYYAFKQIETSAEGSTTSTGWETFLYAIIQVGLSITGTWPMRTEVTDKLKKNKGTLSSSIVLVCRPKTKDMPATTRREFVSALKLELPIALSHLQRSNIAPVDLAQAAIGPGMAIFTRYSKVLDAEGKPLSVRQALALINQTLDEVLVEQEGDFDADSRWALAWFEQEGFSKGEFGAADTLSKAKNISVQGLVDAEIIESGRGKVRLLQPNELPEDWDPIKDTRLTHWEMVHHLIRVLEANGESAAAKIMAKLGAKAETARELCYRLYTMCERKKRTTEALSYNALVQSWPEILRLAREGGGPQEEQAELF